MSKRFYWEEPTGIFNASVSYNELSMLYRTELNLPEVSETDSKHSELIDCTLTVTKDRMLSKGRIPVIYEGELRISNSHEDKTYNDDLITMRSFKFIKNTKFYYKLRQLFNI